MSLPGAERVVAAGERSGKVYGLSHPMRFQHARTPLFEKLRRGEDHVRHIAGRFFIKRSDLFSVGGIEPARLSEGTMDELAGTRTNVIGL
jgi:hypothetical protein